MTDHKTHAHLWDPAQEALSPSQMARRIDQSVSRQGWGRIMKLILKRKGSLSGLRVAEVGCGTGTASLILALCGARVTLIDVNEKVLEATKKIYADFDCPAEFVKADCMDPLPPALAGAFDLATSGGVAEHFTGDYRIRIFQYHRGLLREGGVAVIGVPNRLSPFYHWVRSFRTLTGTWDLDVEVPYSNPELKSLAQQTGFKDCAVIGSESLARDSWVYSRGFISAVVDLLPRIVREGARGYKKKIVDRSSPADPKLYARRRSQEAAASAQRENDAGRHTLTDWFSAGIDLVGFT